MRKEIVVAPLNGETKSESVYRTGAVAFENLENYESYDVYVNKVYYPWEFRFWFDSPVKNNILVINITVQNHGNIAYQQRLSTALESDEERNDYLMQELLWSVCMSIDDFWGKKHMHEL